MLKSVWLILDDVDTLEVDIVYLPKRVLISLAVSLSKVNK